MRLRMCLFAALMCAPALATAQTTSMFSNLANPAIGMNALFTGQAARNLDQAYGLGFDEAEMSVISTVDPYWTFVSNIVFVGDGSVDPEEAWVRSTNVPSIQLKLGKIQRRLFENHRVTLNYDQPLVDEVARRCTEVESGARNVDNILTNTLLPQISRQLLAGMAEGHKITSINVSVGPDSSFVYA